MPNPSDASESRPPAAAAPLSALEARALGCLIEKELATPEYYPLSLNALAAACNQKNNRDPVLNLAPREVELALDGLRRQRLAALFAGADARVPKFKQTIDLVHPMETADRAVLCELLLRGPQTAAELRTRCERLFAFPGLGAVEASLARLASRTAGPLVARLARQPGQKEPRWAQLLTGSIEEHEATVAPVGEPLKVEIRLPEEVEARFAALENDVRALRASMAELRTALGLGASS
jgi:hypothetical protein